MFTQCYLRRMRSTFSLLLLAGLISIASVAQAASVGFPFVTTDLSGTRTSGVTIAIGGVTLTAGTPATVTGYPLAGGGGVTCSVTLANPGGGALYTLNYDASLTGDVYFPLTITKGGSTFAAITDAICSVDAANSATAVTQTTSAQQQANAIAALTAQGYTVTRSAKLDNADVATSTRMASGSVTVGAYGAGTSPDALVWNAAAATYNGAGSMGQKVNAAGTAGDPLTAAAPGAYAAGTAGYRIGHMLTDASAPSWYTNPLTPTQYAVAPGWYTGPPSDYLNTAELAKLNGTMQASAYVQGLTPAQYAIAPTWWIAPGTDTPGVTTLLARPAAPTALQIAAAYDAEVIDGGLTRKQEDALRYSIDHRLYKSNKLTSTSVVTTRYYAPDGVTLYATSVYTPQAGTTDATRTWTYATALTSL